MHPNNLSSVYIYGSGEFGTIIKSYADKYNVSISGFIDKNRNKTGLFINNVKVFSLEQFSVLVQENKRSAKYTYLVEGIFNSAIVKSLFTDDVKVITAKDFLIEASGGKFTSFGSLVNPIYFPGREFNIDKLLNIFDDSKSKQAILNLIDFQKGKVKHQILHDSPSQLYFDGEFINKNILINMLDCGAYNGDTILLAHNYFGNNLGSVIAIEPSQSFLNSSIVNYCSNHDIQLSFFSCGLNDTSSFMGFSSLGEVSDTIDKDSEFKFYFSRIDDLPITQKINFIKFDIEGSELAALKGGINFIQLNRPILAVSLYHKPLDFYDIPLYLSQNLSSYKYYFRQYADDCWETTLYAIPI